MNNVAYYKQFYSPIYAKIDAADTVSFDVFDTAILRSFNSNECADRASRLFPHMDRAKWELHQCYANYKVKHLYEYARSQNKRILFISDMYLSQGAITDILTVNGYVGEIFVSSDERLGGASKGDDGKLFGVIRDRLRLTPSKWLHIGDDAHADGNGRLIGINTHIIPKVGEKQSDYTCQRLYSRLLPLHGDPLTVSFCRRLYEACPCTDGLFYKLGYTASAAACWIYNKSAESVVNDRELNAVGWIMRDVEMAGKLSTLTVKNATFYCNWTIRDKCLSDVKYQKRYEKYLEKSGLLTSDHVLFVDTMTNTCSLYNLLRDTMEYKNAHFMTGFYGNINHDTAKLHKLLCGQMYDVGTSIEEIMRCTTGYCYDFTEDGEPILWSDVEPLLVLPYRYISNGCRDGYDRIKKFDHILDVSTMKSFFNLVCQNMLTEETRYINKNKY